MMPWAWYAREVDDDAYDLTGECSSREAVISEASAQLRPGDRFEIIEARMSSAKEHEGSDFVPFLRTRNHEVLTVKSQEQNDG